MGLYQVVAFALMGQVGYGFNLDKSAVWYQAL